MIRSVAILGVAFGCAVGPNEAPAQAADAIVVIRSDFGGGRAGIGTGFFISARGEILTAYHVIEGARGLTVSHRGKIYTEVLVDRIAPDRDLATLVVRTTEPTPFLRLAHQLPPGLSNETLTIIGHPDGNLYQQLDTRMTTTGYRLSGSIRGPGQAPLFRRADVKLIQLAGIVISGMSGGPVIAPHGVIGVLSGSRDEGGSLAWAIPSLYVNDSTMQKVGKTVPAVGRWAELTLMHSRWKNLRHSVRIDDRVTPALNKYFVAVEDSRNALARMMDRLESTVASIRMTRMVAADRARARQPFTPADSVLLEHLTERVKQFVEGGNEWLGTRQQVVTQLTNLMLLLEGYVGAYPRTQRNDSIMDLFMSPLHKLEARLLLADSGHVVFTNRIVPAFMKLIVTFGAAEDTPASVADALTQLEPILVALGDNEGRLTLNREAALMNEAGIMMERVLLAGFDEPNTDWRWSSGFGYEIIVPAGWEIAAGPEDKEASEIKAGLDAEGIVLDRLFGSRLSNGDSSVLSIFMIGRSQVVIPPDSLAVFGANMKASAAAGSVVELVDQPNRAVIIRTLMDRGERTILRCDAIVAGALQTVMVRLSLPPDRTDLLTRCRSIVDSVLFTN